MKYFWYSWYHYPEKMGVFKLDYPHWISVDYPRNKNIDGIPIYSAIPYRELPYNAVNNPTNIIYKSYDVRPTRIDWINKQIKAGSPFNEQFIWADWMKWPD